MEFGENKTFINDNEESLGFLSNININSKQSYSIKVIWKSLFFLSIVAITSYSYLNKIRYYNLYFDDNCVMKNKQINNTITNNNDMKHAILLLASYGIDYLNNFLEQFNNDSRFDIYIHIDGKTKIDIDNNKTMIKSNIKYYNNSFKSERFSLGMGDAMYELLFIANKNYEYDYYHFMSESCYFTDSLDEFYNFFVNNNLNSYINFYTDNQFLFNGKPNILYKGSQWMSIHKNIVNKLLQATDLYNNYKEYIKNGTVKLPYGAFDEFVFQNLIIKDICNRKPKDCKIYNNNLRFVRWHCTRTNIYCPNYLNIDNISEEEIKYINLHSFIIRKINYKDPKAIELIDKIKNYHDNKE
jgi:hypothetical protein